LSSLKIVKIAKRAWLYHVETIFEQLSTSHKFFDVYDISLYFFTSLDSADTKLWIFYSWFYVKGG